MLRNGDGYLDPTMSAAVRKTDKPVYDPKPVFTQSVNVPPPPVFISRNRALPISEMDLVDLKPLLKGCHKSNGDPEVCTGCGGCAFGTRAAELLNEMKKENKNVMSGREKGSQMVRAKAMMDYQSAIDSGDMVQWVIDHMKHRTEQSDSVIRNMARNKIKKWRKQYGGLIKETPEAAASMDPSMKQVPKHVEVPVEENEPHLMQMPCLSKKILAEKEAAQKVEVEIGATVPPLPSEPARHPASVLIDMFTSKLTDLREQVSELQSQIASLEGAAELLGLTV